MVCESFFFGCYMNGDFDGGWGLSDDVDGLGYKGLGRFEHLGDVDIL